MDDNFVSQVSQFFCSFRNGYNSNVSQLTLSGVLRSHFFSDDHTRSLIQLCNVWQTFKLRPVGFYYNFRCHTRPVVGVYFLPGFHRKSLHAPQYSFKEEHGLYLAKVFCVLATVVLLQYIAVYAFAKRK